MGDGGFAGDVAWRLRACIPTRWQLSPDDVRFNRRLHLMIAFGGPHILKSNPFSDLENRFFLLSELKSTASLGIADKPAGLSTRTVGRMPHCAEHDPVVCSPIHRLYSTDDCECT